MKAMLGLLAFLFALSAATPDVATAQGAASATKPLPATYVSAADIQANLSAAPNSATNPQPNIRVVDAGGYNVAVGVIHRQQTPPGVAAVHSKVSEIYHVLKGSATFVTGGTLVNAKTREAGSMEVTEDGPGSSGTAIQGGVTRQLKAGDVIIIPAGTPHWFSKIDGSIAYLAIRVDPRQVVKLQ